MGTIEGVYVSMLLTSISLMTFIDICPTGGWVRRTYTQPAQSSYNDEIEAQPLL